MYPGHGNAPMGSMPNPIGSGDPVSSRGQYHVHQQHQQYHQQPPQQSQFHQQQHHHHHHHHHHHQLLQGQGQGQGGHVHRHGQHVHSHSRHSHAHERSASNRDERRDSSGHHHHHGSLPAPFTVATGGETPYRVLQPQQHVGGFVMGTDLQTAATPPTSSGWYHEQPEVPHVQSTMTSSLESPVPRQEEKSAVPKDSESYVFGEVKDGRQSMGHKEPVKPLLQEGWRASSVKCTVPKLYQPSTGASPKPFVITSNTEVSKSLDHPRNKDGNNPILHCIELQHHVDELKSIVSTLPSRPQELVPSTLLHPSAPPKPSRFYSEPQTRQRYDPLQASQEKLATVHLDQTALHLLLRKSTAAICAHVGYDDASSRALDTLTDVMGNFLSNFCKIMRINADRLQESGSLAFQDVMDQSLHQCGVRGKAELHQFWKGNVTNYMRYLNGEVDNQMAEYKALTDPDSGKQKRSPVPSSLQLSRAKDQQELRLPSIWPAATPVNAPGGFLDEELTLDTVNLENVLPTKTPDLSGPSIEFSQFSDAAAQESEGFTPLTVDGPPRKRLRTMPLEPQIT